MNCLEIKSIEEVEDGYILLLNNNKKYIAHSPLELSRKIIYLLQNKKN